VRTERDERRLKEKRKMERERERERERNLILYVFNLTYLVRKLIQRNVALSPYFEPRQ
jgi:hypothetical protein